MRRKSAGAPGAPWRSIPRTVGPSPASGSPTWSWGSLPGDAQRPPLPGYHEDAVSALKEVRPTTLEWLETAKSYASYSNRGGQYDDLVQFFEGGSE